MVISDEIRAVPQNRKSWNSVSNPSAEEKRTRNSVPLNKNRKNLGEFRSEPFPRRGNYSEQEAASQNSKIVSEKRTFEVPKNHFCVL
jgi:hypothetical protein